MVEHLDFSHSDCVVAHSASLRDIDGESFVFSDEENTDWHLLQVSDPGFSDCYLEVKLTARPCEQCDTEVYINAFGGLDLLIVSASGDIKGGVARRSGKVTVDHDGSLQISVTYHSVHPTVLLGTSQQGRGSYEGSGREQYVFSDFHVHALERRADEKLILGRHRSRRRCRWTVATLLGRPSVHLVRTIGRWRICASKAVWDQPCPAGLRDGAQRRGRSPRAQRDAFS